MSDRVFQALTCYLRKLASTNAPLVQLYDLFGLSYVLPTKPGPTVVVQGFWGVVYACHCRLIEPLFGETGLWYRPEQEKPENQVHWD